MTKKYILSFALFNVLFLALLFAVDNLAKGLHINKVTWAIYTLFLISTVAVHLFITSGDQSKANMFVRKFMLATALKLFLYLGIIVFCFLFYKDIAKPFILWFLLHYVFFTAFETIMLYAKPNK